MTAPVLVPRPRQSVRIRVESCARTVHLALSPLQRLALRWALARGVMGLA